MKNGLFLIVVLPFACMAQINIPPGIDVAAIKDTDIAIQTPGNIFNNNTFDFSNTNLLLELNGGTQSITGNFVIDELLLSAGGTKTHGGKITVTNKLTLTNGVLMPSGVDKKFLFSGQADGISGGSDNAHYAGAFYSSGSGKRIFPIGKGGVYAPAELESTTGEVGIQVVNANAALTFDDVAITEINGDRYWEILTDVTQINSRIVLSLNGLDAFVNSGGGNTVVQANRLGGLVTNIGSSTSNDKIIVSLSNVSAPILTLAKEININIKIHDLITPAGSIGVNDKLFIENIHRFDHNTVTLLDRWGVLVAKWSNYTNDINYDFSKLGPGSYICIVEYGNGDSNKVEQQMVTVLKTN